MARFIVGLTLALPLASNAQYFQYTQYNFTDQRVNPGLVASSDYATVGFIFRNQSTGSEDVHVKSSSVSAVYPFLNRKSGRRWSGLGISLMDDRSGGLFALQEVSLSYAINIFLSRYQTLSLGFKGLYQQRKVTLNGLYTGSQYIQDRGFDESLFNGENFGLLRSNFTTFSSGIYWQQSDRDGRILAYWGFSFFDLNKPSDSFHGAESELPSTFVAAAGIRVYHQENISLRPEFLLTRTANRFVVNLGAITSYELKPYPNQIAGRIDVITKYIPGRSGILGLQFHRDQLSIGFSYDFPVVKRNPANTGAFEVGLQVKRLVHPAAMRRIVRNKKSRRGYQVSKERKAVIKPDSVGRISRSKPQSAMDSVTHSPNTEPDLLTSLKQKADSVIANARAGHISHEPFVIEKQTLNFNFEFNSTRLDDRSRKYLDDLATALSDNEHMKIKLTGHTDNVGSAAFNMRLSVYRANVISQYLIEGGVDASRIETEGKGLTEPLNENATESERAMNRRVELLIYYQP